MINAFAILFLILASTVFGAVIHRVFFTDRAPPGLFQFKLTNSAIARIVHEAYRAYSNSVGNIGVRGWASLEQSEKAKLVDAVRTLRNDVARIPAEAAHLKEHLLHAIVRLFEPANG